VPEKYRDLYDPETLPLPKNFMPKHPFDNGELHVRDEELASIPRQPEDIRTHLRDYYGMISHLDAQIGRILDTLDEQGLAENTLIILAGDNGLALGQHGLMGKQNLYDHSVKVPLILSGPGVPAGERVSALCYLHDIYPTVCDLARVRVPETVESKSLTPVLRDPKESIRNAVIFAYKNFQRGGRFGPWKLILYLVEGNKTVQLFDLKNDPWERYNLAYEPDYRSKAEELTARLQVLLTDAGDAVDLSAPDWGVPVIPSW
jgi:arylsulfatase A-like enzyme